MRHFKLLKTLIMLVIFSCFWPVTQGYFSIFSNSADLMSMTALPASVLTPNHSSAKYIVIDIADKQLNLYVNETLEKSYRVAVGTRKTPSPVGDFKIINKDYNWGTGFGTRWMGLNVPWGIFGIHGTNKPWSIGSNASHGCIRMHNKSVEELFELVPVGTPVIIMNSSQPYPVLRGRNLKRGMTGQDVVYVQRRLKEIGLYGELADGRYGVMTALAVSYFQFLNGCPPTGVVDRRTYDLLMLPVRK